MYVRRAVEVPDGEAEVTKEMAGFLLPRLYAILDAGVLHARGISIRAMAEDLRDAGARLVQYRDKVGAPQEVLRVAAEIAAVFDGVEATLILNDRADLAMLAGWGVHVGQGDLPVEDARRVVGVGKIVGVSTHNDAQVKVADASVVLPPGAKDPDPAYPKSLIERFCMGADYVAVGPVFATSTKSDAEPVVGPEGVRRARGVTKKPLVAIGGITRENAHSVIKAGADAVAVIGALLPAEGMSARQRAEELIALLGG